MEDKKLNEKESLELITQMIQNTRRNLVVLVFAMIIPGYMLNSEAKKDVSVGN